MKALTPPTSSQGSGSLSPQIEESLPRGPGLCFALARSRGGAWGSISPKKDRWAGRPQCPSFEQPFCFPAKQPTSVPSHLPLSGTPSVLGLAAGAKGRCEAGALPLYDGWGMKGNSNWCGATVPICLLVSRARDPIRSCSWLSMHCWAQTFCLSG